MSDEKNPSPHDFFPEPNPMTPEERAAVYAKLKAEFSAADLQRFTEIEEGIPMEQIIEEMEKIHRDATGSSI